ncbi:RDD family protein [Oleiharenicola sp. Vm1]|uniref:RDD family protein n=1 Tax=Oleiharenicola sp. Vm1 TaxID=3398393 RepID=UPI0039F58047
MGPVGAAAFEGLLRDNIVSADTLVWAKGMAEWQRWSQVEPTTGVCSVSGGRFFTRDLVAHDGRLVSAEQKDDYFQRVREGVNQVGEMRYAGFWVRFLAKFLDGLLLWIPNMLINVAWSMVFFGRFMFSPQLNQFNAGTWFAYQGVAFLSNTLVTLIYQWFFLTRYAATPGKLALGLKVVRSDGSAITGGRAIGRGLSEILSQIILFIGYLIAAFDDEKRALHDRICDTRVIRTK